MKNTALLVEPGNVTELSSAILRPAGDPELRRRLGGSARDAAMHLHAWRRNAECIIAEYDLFKVQTQKIGA
jgi:glycosyltransferase involved in cell wall biosynthesis